MSAAEQLTIATEQPADQETALPESLYEAAEEIEAPLDLVLGRDEARFITAGCRELGKDFEYFGLEDNGIRPDHAQLVRLVEREPPR